MHFGVITWGYFPYTANNIPLLWSKQFCYPQIRIVSESLGYYFNWVVFDIYIISDYLVGIQIDIFTDIIFKFITLKLLASSESIIFCFSLLAFCSHQVHIWGILVLLLLGFIPVASHGRLLLNHSLIACRSSSLRCLSPHSLITSIKTVLLIRNYNYSAKQWNPKPILCIT